VAAVSGELSATLKTVRQVAPRDQRVTDQVYERLRDLIVGGRLGPHDRLHQTRLAEALGVSRTPIREALLRLEQEGLAYSLPGRGLFVKGASAKDVADLYEVRVILEPQAARLACERATRRDLIELDRALTRVMGSGAGLASAFKANRDFHLTVVRPCGNPMLVRVLANVWDQKAALPGFAEYTKVTELDAHMRVEHVELADAFQAGRSDRVEKLVRAHIASAATRVQGLFERTSNPATAG
jgi:DNA-binding GntR family transcriptional regulator